MSKVCLENMATILKLGVSLPNYLAEFTTVLAQITKSQEPNFVSSAMNPFVSLIAMYIVSLISKGSRRR